MYRPPPSSPLFPSTTLFRSLARAAARALKARCADSPWSQPPHRPAKPVARRRHRQRRALLTINPIGADGWLLASVGVLLDRKSTRLNSSLSQISYAVFCLKN